MTLRQGMSFIGLLGLAEKQILFGRLHISPIHCCLWHQYKAELHSLERQIAMVQEAIQAINWWTDLGSFKTDKPLGNFRPDISLFTDASKTSLGGAHAPGFLAPDDWSLEETLMSSYALELLAVRKVLSP